MVLRSREPARLVPELGQLRDLGVRHVEISWSPHPDWCAQGRALLAGFPDLRLGAASVCTSEAIAAASAAGFAYAVSPILRRSLLRQAEAAGLTLVPGVMTPSEVHRARRWGARIVKLFPAAPLGPTYWRRLGDPLGAPLPFCIAAGGLGPDEVLSWLKAGVDAVALGSRLLGEAGRFDPKPVRVLLRELQRG